ncbi:MAG: tyrosine--tRNA ligase [Chloroflexi bacterium]|nr:MAG: tyrosine--tRNA ligase [Chloroflexota bacterium]
MTTTKRTMAPVDEQLAILMRGTDFGDEQTYRAMERELRAKLNEDRPLRVYCGYDPTSVDLTLGHTVTFRKLKQFQDFGHEITFLIGNFTGLIGDPTDKDKTRPMINAETLAANSVRYAEQAGRILDMSRAVVRHNADWLAPLTFEDVIRLCAKFTVAEFLKRESFAKRYSGGEPIYLSEFMYGLLQAYDAYELKTDVQVGGRDQLFNLMAGRKLQQEMGHPQQVVIMTPLLVGLDGHEKMSKSLGNYIAVDDAPNDMYGKAMSIPDEVMQNYFELLTDVTADDVQALLASVAAKELPPIEAKKRLALEITSTLYPRAEAEGAQVYFESTFQRRETPDEMQEYVLSGATERLTDVLVAASMAASNGEVRRLVTQGAVRVNGEATSDFAVELKAGDEVRVGRTRFLRLVAGN